jgi:ArsR family transcriptional regulator, lead/cadmium/zinc/bismuth-responsive transcriptional repressor
MLLEKEVAKIQKQLQAGQDKMSLVFEALGDPTRLKIFRLLAQKKDLCVTDIANVCGVSVPAASYQLKILEVVGLAQKERSGKMTCYELQEGTIVQKVLKVIK